MRRVAGAHSSSFFLWRKKLLQLVFGEQVWCFFIKINKLPYGAGIVLRRDWVRSLKPASCKTMIDQVSFNRLILNGVFVSLGNWDATTVT